MDCRARAGTWSVWDIFGHKLKFYKFLPENFIFGLFGFFQVFIFDISVVLIGIAPF